MLNIAVAARAAGRVLAADVRRGLRRLPCLRRCRVTLQPVGFGADDLVELASLAVELGQRLGLQLRLAPQRGDIVLIDLEFAVRTPPPRLRDMTGARPVLLVGGGELHPAEERREHRHDTLLDQLQALPLVRQRAALWHDSGGWTPGTGIDRTSIAPSDAGRDGPASEPAGDTGALLPDGARHTAAALDRERALVLDIVARGLADARTPPLAVSWGPAADMWFDFHGGFVAGDLRARQQLRIGGELPLPASRPARSRARGEVRELDLVAWELGLAGGGLPLRDAPADWWHTPLAAEPTLDVRRYTALPSHLELARCIAQGAAVTPSQLRLRGRVGTGELRSFLQACLLLRLVRWAPPRSG